MINKLVFLFYTSFLNDWYPIRHNTKCNLTIYQINGKSYQNIEVTVDPFFRYSTITISNISLLYKSKKMYEDFNKYYKKALIEKTQFIPFFIHKEILSANIRIAYQDEKNFKQIIPLILIDKSISNYYIYDPYIQELNGKIPILILDYRQLNIFLDKNDVYVSLNYSKEIPANKVALYLSLIFMLLVNIISLIWGLLFYKIPRRYKIEIHGVILFLLITKCILSYFNLIYIYKKKKEFEKKIDFSSEKIIKIIMLVINYILKVVICFISFIETDSNLDPMLEEREVKSNAGNLVILFLFLIGAAEGNEFNQIDLSLILFSFYYICIGIYVSIHAYKMKKSLISNLDIVRIQNPERVASLRFKIKILSYHIITLDSFVIFYILVVFIINKFLFEYINLYVIQVLNVHLDIFQYIGLMLTYLPRKLPRYAIFGLLYYLDDEYQFLDEEDYFESYGVNLFKEKSYLTKEDLKNIKNNIDGYTIFAVTNPFFHQDNKELQIDKIKVGLHFNE